MKAAPAPWEWASDATSHVASTLVDAAGGGLFAGATEWVLDGLGWAAGEALGFFDRATSPSLSASWFATGPLAQTTAVAAALLGVFALFAVIQGVVTADAGGMIRQIAFVLPMTVLAIVALGGATQLAIAITDAMAGWVLGAAAGDARAFADTITDALAGVGSQPSFAVLLLAVVGALAGLVVVIELTIRSALIYLVVALAPLAFAAQMWPALRGVARRTVELLAAIIVSKLVIAVALSVAVAGLAATRDPYAITTPEHTAGGGSAPAIGVLLAAVAGFAVAAFSPAVVLRLLPFTEAALVASGARAAATRTASRGAALVATGGRSHNLHALAARPHTSPAASHVPPIPPASTPPPVAAPPPRTASPTAAAPRPTKDPSRHE